MKTPGFVWVTVLLLVGPAQMLSSTRAYINKRWEPEPSALVPGAGAWTWGIAEPQAQGMAGVSGNVHEGTTYLYPRPESSSISSIPWARELESLLSNLAASAAGGADAVRPVGVPLVGSADEEYVRVTNQHWAADSPSYVQTALVGDGSRLDLPALTEVSWSENPLFAEDEAFLMEQVVFPALGAFLLFCIVTVAVMRHRERRAAQPVRHLLQV